jgi:hypothetical protein
MNRNDIIRMAEEADAYADKKLGLGEWHPDKHEVRDEHFAKLVAAAQREESAELAQEMIDVEYMLDDFAKSIRIGMRRMCDDGRPKWLKDSMQVAAEREACAKLCEEDGLLWGKKYAAAIRARGVNNGT